jgi:hypothetical protein
MVSDSWASEERTARPNEEFRTSLDRLLSAERRHRLRGAVSIIACAALAAFSVLLAVDFHLGGARFFSLFAFIFFWGAVVSAVSFAVVRQIFPLGNAREFAGRLDGRLGGNLLAAALEFSRGAERHGAYSTYLLEATVSRASNRLRAFDARGLFSVAGRPGWTGAGVLAGVLVSLQIVFLRGDPAAVIGSIADPGRSFRAPHWYNLVVTSGDRSVMPGEEVTAEAMNFGSMRGAATLWVSTIPGVWNRLEVPGAPVSAR